VPIDAAVSADPESFMAGALDAARDAAAEGDVPVGAVAVRGGRIIATAANRRERDQDPTAHAEMLVLRAAAALLGRWRLDDVTVVVSLEPCPMCAGALWASRIGGVVVGAADPRAGATGSLYNLSCDPRLNHEYPLMVGVSADESSALLTDFFTARRGTDGPPAP
jgi:tRNA(adenine34) deaminase